MAFIYLHSSLLYVLAGVDFTIRSFFIAENGYHIVSKNYNTFIIEEMYVFTSKQCRSDSFFNIGTMEPLCLNSIPMNGLGIHNNDFLI